MATLPIRRADHSGLTLLGLSEAHSVYAQPAPDMPPDEDLPGSFEPWHAVEPLRPDTAFVRSCRFLDRMGETLAALALIVGGAAVIGFASLCGGA